MVIATSLKIGSFIVNLHLSSLIGEHGEYSIQFGLGDKSLQKFGNIQIDNRHIKITTDYFSGQRIYYWQIEGSIFITDNVFNFLKAEDLNLLNKNIFESTLFAKHGYTSGNATVYEIIKKVPPASSLEVSSEGIKLTSNWDLGNILNQPSRQNFELAIYNTVKSELLPLKTINRNIVLCFSGGKDSTYLASILNELGINYEMVFFRDASLKVNNREVITAQDQARRLGKELRLINIQDITDNVIEEEIQKFRHFDRHYCKYHFYGLAKLKKVFGPDTIIINGQNSDSILSYGPSEEKFSSKVKRYLLYGNNHILKKSIAIIIGCLFRQILRVPKTEEEKLDAFYDNYKYCLLLDRRTSYYRSCFDLFR